MSRDRKSKPGSFKKYVEFPPEELLIDFSDNADEKKSVTPSKDSVCAGDKEPYLSDDMPSPPPSPPVSTTCKQSEEHAGLLCGYMNKLSSGIVKNFRKRWFVYSENTCKLLYFRTPQDIINVGEIDISKASFHFDAEREDVPGLFEIRSGGKAFVLQAADRQAMMFWLQELQKKRWFYSHERTAISQQLTLISEVTVKQPKAGLIGQEQSGMDNIAWDEFAMSSPEFLAPVSIPCSVGQDSPYKASAKFSLKNLKTEIRNTMATRRKNRQIEAASDKQPASEAIPVHEYVTDFPQQIPVELNSGNARISLSNSWQSGVFTSLRRKLSKSRENLAGDDSMTISSPSSGNKDSCTACAQLQQYVLTLKDDLQGIEEELQAHRELVSIMQHQIDSMETEKQTRQELVLIGSDEDSQMALILEKAKLVSDLEHLLDATHQEKDMITQQMKQLKAELDTTKKDVQMYRESLVAKDEMMISLTNNLFELESSNFDKNQNSSQRTNDDHARANTYYSAYEVEKWKDKLRGYEVQNKFLNKEILELNELRTEEDKREKMLIGKCAELEARFYQIQSRYLLCLEQLRQPQMGSESNPSQEMVNQLLQEAIDMDMDATSSQILTSGNTSPNRSSSYDQYGFSTLANDSDEDLIAKATTLQRKSEEITNKMKDVNLEISLEVRWENYLLSVGSRELQRTPELKALVRYGIPHQHKERVWNACVNLRVGRLREKLGPKYYQNLNNSKQRSGKHNPAAKQIELDLLRTLPTNKHYTTVHSDGVNKLRRVLLAYSWHNPVIGYCQGLNRLVAIALLFLTEEDSFWLLVAVIDFIMPKDYYTTTLMAAQTDQRVLKDLIAEKLPRLHAHLEKNEVDLSLFTFNWFLTVFVDNIPVETYLRIWDAFLYEGNKVLFRFALAVFKYREDEILKLNETMPINKYLRVIGEQMIDIRRIAQIAFLELNPFPMRNISIKRNQYLLQVKGELAELDALREDCRAHQDPRDRSDYASDEEL